MNRVRYIPKATCVLALMLCCIGLRGQSFHLEYWFDRYEDPQSLYLPGGKLSFSIKTEGLSDGFHTMYMRAVDNDGMYSPVSSAAFLKFTALENSNIEYWFDDDISKLQTTDINIKDTTKQVLMLDLTDAVKFPLGFHKLSMRVAAFGNLYSPIYSTHVMRLPTSEMTELSYWLDDNYKERRIVKGRYESGGGGGGGTSWSRRNTSGSVFESGQSILFLDSLNFSGASSGMHRLKFRITSNGYDDGVIYETPLLVTRRYNNQRNVTVTGESTWLDELAHSENNAFTPQSVIVRNYILDPTAFSVGQHALHLQYKNSAEVWSEQNITYFYKDAASGRLFQGLMPEDTEGIYDATSDDNVLCAYADGTVYVDCQSLKLEPTGAIMIYDMKGRLIASQTVANSNGIHAQINVSGVANQILIAKVQSGDIRFVKKLAVK